MSWQRHPRTKFLLAFVGIIAVVASLVFRLSRVSRPYRQPSPAIARPTAAPSPVPQFTPPDNVSATPQVAPSEIVVPSPQPTVSQIQPSPSPLPNSGSTLLIPVAGIRADQLRDTFTEARSEGRVHDAIDIPAAHGTPVLAAADGTIVKLFQSERGGTTIYELSADQQYFYYYAHLDRYAEGVAAGKTIKQGEVIAYVGDTGDAGAGNYHLHFSITIVKDPKRWWEGTNINPYPLLRK